MKRLSFKNTKRSNWIRLTSKKIINLAKDYASFCSSFLYILYKTFECFRPFSRFHSVLFLQNIFNLFGQNILICFYKMSSINYRICLALFSWVCFVSSLVTDLATMYKGQELKFFIYLTNWGLILLNALLALEVYTNLRKILCFSKPAMLKNICLLF